MNYEPWLLWCIWGVLILLLVLGDVKTRNSIFITPEKVAALDFETWPKWTEVEDPDSRIRMLWILHDYVPFVNAGSEICSHTINRELMKKPYKYDIWVASPGYPRRTYEGIRCVSPVIWKHCALTISIDQNNHNTGWTA